VRDRLARFAQATGRPFDFILRLYFHERFLARLAASPYRDRFVLKGASLLFATAQDAERMRSRPTRDIDLLGRGSISGPDDLRKVFHDVAAIPLADGIVFDPKTVQAERIIEGAEYSGVRIHFWGKLGQARERLQIDVAFGHAMTPGPRKIRYPLLLGGEGLELHGYPLETVVSEKFEAMVKLSTENSRMKDFYDLYILASTHDFDGAMIGKALARTFQRRRTKLTLDTPILREPFRSNRERQAQWTGFLRRARLSDAPGAFEETMALILAFVGTAYEACCGGTEFKRTWSSVRHRWE
jgi:hypothetical protein